VKSAVYYTENVEERLEQHNKQKLTERWMLPMTQITKGIYNVKVEITFTSSHYLLQLRPASISDS